MNKTRHSEEFKREAAKISAGTRHCYKRMTKTVIFFFSIACLTTAPPANAEDQIAKWESCAANLLEADTIIVQQNWHTKTPIGDLPKRIKHGKKYHKRFLKRLSEKEKSDLANYFVFDESRDSRTLCGCRGLFQVEFLREKELVFSFVYAHGKSSAPISKKSEELILSFLDSKGFPTNDWINMERATNEVH